MPRQPNATENWLGDWLESHDVPVGPPRSTENGRKWILDACPFNPEHAGTSAAVGERSSGAYWFKCQHDGCATYVVWRASQGLS
jgi:hypothetical protein